SIDGKGIDSGSCTGRRRSLEGGRITRSGRSGVENTIDRFAQRLDLALQVEQLALQVVKCTLLGSDLLAIILQRLDVLVLDAEQPLNDGVRVDARAKTTERQTVDIERGHG